MAHDSHVRTSSISIVVPSVVAGALTINRTWPGTHHAKFPEPVSVGPG